MKRFFFWNKDDPKPEGKGEPGRDREESGRSGLLTGDPVADERSLKILLESIAEVSSSFALDRVLEAIVDKSLQVTEAERALLFLGSTPDELQVKLARDREGGDLPTDQLYSTSVVRKSLTEGEAIRSVVQSDREALELGQSVFDLKLRAVMCAPLRVKSKTIGAIYVDSKGARREFSARDLALFDALSQQLAVAVENARLLADSLEKIRLEKDLQIAKRIQSHLVAPVPERVEGLELALRYTPVAAASGDTYDFVPLGEGRYALIMGDVTGHGVGAALVTHAAQAALRSYLELIDDVPQVVTRLNSRLAASVEEGNFMSLLLVLVDAKQKKLWYVNAGHPGLIHVRAQAGVGKDAGVQEYEKTGMVLGVVADQRYQAKGPIELGVGDVLLLRTDGVDETMNKAHEVYGLDRLCAFLAKNRALAPKALLDSLTQSLEVFAGGEPLGDDLTVLCIKVLP